MWQRAWRERGSGDEEQGRGKGHKWHKGEKEKEGEKEEEGEEVDKGGWYDEGDETDKGDERDKGGKGERGIWIIMIFFATSEISHMFVANICGKITTIICGAKIAVVEKP